MSAVESKLRISQDAGGIGPVRDNVVISPKGVGGNLVFLPLFPENNSVAKSAGGEGVPIPILYPSSAEVAEMRGRRPYTVGRLPGSAVESGSIGLWLADPRVVGTASFALSHQAGLQRPGRLATGGKKKRDGGSLAELTSVSASCKIRLSRGEEREPVGGRSESVAESQRGE